MIVKLLTEHHLEFLSLKGGCRGWSESTHVKMPHCWKSHALAQIIVRCFEVVWHLLFVSYYYCFVFAYTQIDALLSLISKLYFALPCADPEKGQGVRTLPS